MKVYTLSRADIRTATGWQYRRIRTLIERPYRLDSRRDPASHLGGGQTERFRLSDILVRAKSQGNFLEEMGAKLIAADAAHRREQKK